MRRCQRAAAPHGLRFGPDPSTHTRCTIGGMIGNNACGSRALGYGRTADNVAGLKVAFGTGEVASVGGGVRSSTGADARLGWLADDHLAHVRTSFGRFSRQVSGYSLEHLLPENGRRPRPVPGRLGGHAGRRARGDRRAGPRRAAIGCSSSWATRRWPRPPTRCRRCSGARAGGLVAPARGWTPGSSTSSAARGGAVPALPRGAGWLFVEVAGPEARPGRRGVARPGRWTDASIGDPAEAAALWRIREDGAGLAARSLDRPAYSGWEDAAVPPDRLGAWLREFDDLLREHGLDGVPYGHFGDGCVHVRIDFEFDDGGAPVPRVPGRRSASALQRYGGSLSGEHGDGRARSELLPLMYDERVAAAVRRGEGDLRPRRRAQPRRARRPGAARRRPPRRPGRAHRRQRAAAHPRRRIARRRRAPLHRGRQVRGAAPRAA